MAWVWQEFVELGHGGVGAGFAKRHGRCQKLLSTLFKTLNLGGGLGRWLAIRRRLANGGNASLKFQCGQLQPVNVWLNVPATQPMAETLPQNFDGLVGPATGPISFLDPQFQPRGNPGWINHASLRINRTTSRHAGDANPDHQRGNDVAEGQMATAATGGGGHS